MKNLIKNIFTLLLSIGFIAVGARLVFDMQSVRLLPYVSELEGMEKAAVEYLSGAVSRILPESVMKAMKGENSEEPSPEDESTTEESTTDEPSTEDVTTEESTTEDATEESTTEDTTEESTTEPSTEEETDEYSVLEEITDDGVTYENEIHEYSIEKNAEGETTVKFRRLINLIEERKRKNKKFADAPEGYFDDALFIGDSRTEDLELYGNLEGASFFAVVGLSVYNIHSKTANVSGVGNTDFSSLIKNKKFKKIYLSLGINEIGYDRAKTVAKFKSLLNEIQAANSEAIIIIQANIHVTGTITSANKNVKNADLDDFNEKISAFADNEKIFYIDPNVCFDDGNGAMKSECSGDGVHLKAKYARQWADWLRTKAVV